jgi:DNA-directed RNA polymerase specialized sigma24 family protein
MSVAQRMSVAMTDQHAEFTDLLKRVLAGDKDAAREFHALYGDYILYIVRKKLPRRLRSKFDSLDFVQDVWASFFGDIPSKYDFRRPEDLIKFLTAMAHNKVAAAARTRLQRQKYNVGREISLDVIPRGGDHFPDGGSTPSTILMSEEEWVQFLQEQPIVHLRVFLLLREGKT